MGVAGSDVAQETVDIATPGSSSRVSSTEQPKSCDTMAKGVACLAIDSGICGCQALR